MGRHDNPTRPTDVDCVWRLAASEERIDLAKIVRDLETGKAKLDDAVRAYERDFEAALRAKLAAAQAKIEQITVGPDGKISTTPFDSEKPP